jgi:hypothetical protein
MISETFSNQTPAKDSLGFADPSSRSEATAKGNNVAPPIYHIHVNRLVQQIDSPELSSIVGRVFQDLLRLLECVGLVENYLRQVDAAEETFALFQLVHDEARNLVHYIQTDALNSNLLTEPLADTLDGITFAISHDLQRVFDRGPKGWLSERTAQVVVGKLYRAHDVLTNCLQQSTITLALVFDPELIGAKLFNNSDMRYRQSLQLCQDLSELIQLVEDSETSVVQTTIDRLLDRVERFRGESMECLMYSDWPQFEAFCEKLDFAKIHGTEMATVLHQFRCYLETLLGQVRMRNVLADVFPVGVGVEANPHARPAHRTPSGDDFEHPQEDIAGSGLMIAV